MVNTLDFLSEEITKLLLPLRNGFSSPAQAEALLQVLGWRLPPGVQDIGLTGIDVQPLVDKLKIVLNSTPDEENDTMLMANRYANLLAAVKTLINNISSTMQALSHLPQDYRDKTKIHERLLTRLLDFLIIKYFQQYHYSTYSAFVLLGIFKLTKENGNAQDFTTDFIKHEIFYDRLTKIITDPKTLVQAVYGWGTAAFDVRSFLTNLALFLESFGALVQLRKMHPRLEAQLLKRDVPEATTDPMPQADITLMKSLDWDGMEVGLFVFGLRKTSTNSTDGGIGLSPYVRGTPDVLVFPLTSSLFFEITTNLNVQGGVALLLRPGKDLEARSDLLGQGSGATLASGQILFTLRLGSEDGDAIRLLSIPGGSYLETQQMFVSVGAGDTGDKSLDLVVEAGFRGGELFVTTGEGDNFLQTILPKDPFKINFDLIIGFSKTSGIYFRGSGALEIRFPIHFEIGPIAVDGLTIALKVKEGGVKVEAGSDIKGALGPLVIVVENIGLSSTFSFPPNNNGNLGPLQLDIGFKPPTGLGIAIDAGPVTGGGFVSFDKDRGQYSGMLYLDMLAIEVTAIGILSTKDSNGRDLPPPGFSFLIIITVEKLFIQLGFGFILDGVGGLVGIHRTYSSDALEDGIRQGALDSIMFPDDPLNNMPKIINDVDRVFPAQMDQFVFGPLAQIVWGRPAIFKIEVGILIKLPPPIIIVILGQLEALLPADDFPIVELHVDVRGELNFEKKQLLIKVSLRDSRLAFFKMEGEMAFLVDWGSNSNFLLSVGGYHPAFKPPSNFPHLERVGVALNFAGIVQLSVKGYFAISSNSFQFGAEAHIFVGIDEININGWLIFDGLIVFSPFHFTFSFSQGFEVEVGGVSFLGISISGRLSGPSPFRISGEAHITILFFDIPIRFDRKFGDEDPKQLPPLDPWPELRDAIQREESWKASLPPSAYLAGSFRQPKVEDTQLMVHPLGIIEMRQKVLPLNLMLDKYREYSIIGQHKFQLRNVSIGEETVKPKETTGDSGELGTFYTSVSDYFAPGQFKDLDDQDKLQRSSYELMMAGISIGSNRGAYTIKGDSTSIQERPLQYEEKYIDREEPSKLVAGESREIMLAKTHSGAKAYSNLFRTGANKYKERVIMPKTFSIKEETFIVVNTDNLVPYNEFARENPGAVTRVQAVAWMEQHMQRHPEKLDIQILSVNESISH